jgi:hypothetical protein
MALFVDDDKVVVLVSDDGRFGSAVEWGSNTARTATKTRNIYTKRSGEVRTMRRNRIGGTLQKSSSYTSFSTSSIFQLGPDVERARWCLHSSSKLQTLPEWFRKHYVDNERRRGKRDQGQTKCQTKAL